MSYFEKNEMRFFYEEIGEGKPLLFLHGLGGDIEQPKGLLGRQNGIRLIVMDQRAHGKSEIVTDSKITFDEMADDVLALADHLHLEKFCIGGISMGAAVAANLAYRYPERINKLFLVRAAWSEGTMEDDIILWYRTLSHYLQQKNADEYQKSDIFRMIQEKAPEAVDSFLKAFTDPMALAYDWKFRTIPSQCPYDDIENLRKITAQTIVLSNKMDYIHKYQYGQLYMKYLKHAVFHEIVPKAVSVAGHRADLQAYISYYMNVESI